MKPSYKTVKQINLVSAANRVGLGFEYHGMAYLALLPKLYRKYCYIDRQAESHGGARSIRIRISAKQAEKLSRIGVIVGTMQDMNAGNKGERFEQLVYRLFGKQWEKEYIPYNQAPDIQIGLDRIQLKYNGATVTTYKQLKKYAKQIGLE